jgi:hypothetical protein
MIVTLEASGKLVDRFAAALDHWDTLATSAPPEITMLAEANFAAAVRTQEYRWAPVGDEKRAHGYAVVATELARQSDMRFRRHREHNQMPEALIAMAMALVARVKKMPGTGLDRSDTLMDPLMVEAFANAERWITCAGHAAREQLDAANSKITVTADEKLGADSPGCDSVGLKD